MIDNPVHSLTFGDLVWVEEGANPPDASGVTYVVRAQDATFGTAVPVTAALLWLGRAGAPVSWDSTPNREPVFRVTIEADDSDLLARGELALQLQCEQPTELTWTPPDGAGEPSVFDVVWSHLEPVFDRDGLTGVGMEETVLRTRTYLVRMQALPHARGAALVVTPAVAATPTYTLVDNGSALSGAGFSWACTSPSTAVTIVSGKVQLAYSGGARSFLRLDRTGSVDLTGVNFLAFDTTTTLTGVSPNLGAPAGLVFPLVTSADLGGGVTRYFFSVPAGTTTVSDLRLSINAPWTSGKVFAVDQVQKVDAIPFIGTARQRVMSLVPGGSVKTQGSIQVSHATNSLGKTVIYTCPAGIGYLPPLRPWRTSGDTPTTDATLLSGFKNALATPSIYKVPVPNAPTGRVEVWGWVLSTTTRTVTFDSDLISVLATTAIGTGLSATASVSLTANVWKFVALGSYTSPPTQIGSAGFVQLTMHTVDAGAFLDEVYLFGTDEGSLTVVDCGTGTPSAIAGSNRLWIDAPSLDQPTGAIYRGFTADRSDAWHAGSAVNTDVWGTHDFDPLGTSVFVATQNTVDAATSLEHYRRYNTFVTREG